MARSVAQALAAAKKQVSRPTSDWTGWCLKFVRTCWGFRPTGIYNARAAWKQSKKRHITGTPPPGAPVYWEVGKHGHVAISAGDGKCYSNDICKRGKICLTDIDAITRRWNAQYLGWTADYAGVADLPLSGGVSSGEYEPFPGAEFFKGSPKSPIITAMGRRLAAEGCGKYLDGPGPQWTDVDRQSYAAWQRKLGYSGGDADGWPGQKSWDRLKVPRV